MLGVRRAGITGAASALQRRKLIRYERGQVSILDGPGLQDTACGCYAADIETYARILEPPARTSGSIDLAATEQLRA